MCQLITVKSVAKYVEFGSNDYFRFRKEMHSMWNLKISNFTYDASLLSISRPGFKMAPPSICTLMELSLSHFSPDYFQISYMLYFYQSPDVDCMMSSYQDGHQNSRPLLVHRCGHFSAHLAHSFHLYKCTSFINIRKARVYFLFNEQFQRWLLNLT